MNQRIVAIREAGKEYFTGYTKEYVRIAIPRNNYKTNDIVKGKISGFLTDNILLMDVQD